MGIGVSLSVGEDGNRVLKYVEVGAAETLAEVAQAVLREEKVPMRYYLTFGDEEVSPQESVSAVQDQLCKGWLVVHAVPHAEAKRQGGDVDVQGTNHVVATGGGVAAGGSVVTVNHHYYFSRQAQLQGGKCFSLVCFINPASLRVS